MIITLKTLNFYWIWVADNNKAFSDIHVYNDAEYCLRISEWYSHNHPPRVYDRLQDYARLNYLAFSEIISHDISLIFKKFPYFLTL